MNITYHIAIISNQLLNLIRTHKYIMLSMIVPINCSFRTM